MPPKRRPGGFTWNAKSGRYRTPRGTFATRNQVRAAIDAALVNAEKRAVVLGEQLRARKITRPAWESGMRAIVKDVHNYSAAAALGGWDRMSPSDFGRVGQAVRKQYGFLEKFSNEIKRGLPLDGRFTQRVGLYASSGRSTYHTTERREMERRGLDEEKSVLHPADHCEGPGSCVEQARLGWQPIGQMIPIGARICRSRCKCTAEYRRRAA